MLRPQGGWLCSLGLLGAQGRGAAAHGSLPPPRGRLRLAGCGPALEVRRLRAQGSGPGALPASSARASGRGHGGPRLLRAAGQGPDLLSWPWKFTKCSLRTVSRANCGQLHIKTTQRPLSAPQALGFCFCHLPCPEPRNRPASARLHPAHRPQSYLCPRHPERSFCPGHPSHQGPHPRMCLASSPHLPSPSLSSQTPDVPCAPPPFTVILEFWLQTVPPPHRPSCPPAVCGWKMEWKGPAHGG